MRCKLDSTENPRSFEKYPTLPQYAEGFRLFLGGDVSLVGSQEELRYPRGYTRKFTSNPPWEANYGFSGLFSCTANCRKGGKAS